MSAAKKHATTRARANKATTAATLGSGMKVIAPKLPTHPVEFDADGNSIEQDWHEETLEWWADLWASPMAAEYHSSDKHALFILAVLTDQFWRAPGSKLASEIRLQRVAFGLTPYDRRRLEWTIETAEESKDKGKARRDRASSQQPEAEDDPRLTLVS